MNKILIGVCVGVCVFSAQLLLLQQFKINNLNEQLSLTQKAKEIQDDQVNELTYQIYKIQMEHENESTKNFIAGVVATIKNDPNKFYNGIWHDGYNAGLEQEKEIAYTTKKE